MTAIIDVVFFGMFGAGVGTLIAVMYEARVRERRRQMSARRSFVVIQRCHPEITSQVPLTIEHEE